MKKTYLMVALGVLIAINSIAQGEAHESMSRVGLQGSLNISNIRFIEDGFSDWNSDLKPLINGSMGFFYKGAKSPYAATQIGLFYTGKGGQTDSMTLRMHYIQVPLIFNFRMPIYGPVYLQTGFGPYAAIAFHSVEKFNGHTSENIMSFPKSKAEQNKPYNPLDMGLIFAGRVEINLPNETAIEVGVNYEIGLWKISNDHEIIPGADSVNPGIKNRGFAITVAYLFNSPN